MHEKTAAVVRTAIDQTIDRLEGLDAGTPLSDMLVAHLGTLLTIESRVLAVVPRDGHGLAESAIATLQHLGYTYHGGEQWKPPIGPAPVFSEEKPWYPDDSGEWVEVPNTMMTPPPVGEDTIVEALYLNEREGKTYQKNTTTCKSWQWHKDVKNHYRIVAYKVAAPSVATQTPWYPDDSGKWVETHGVDPELSDRLQVQALSIVERENYRHVATHYRPSTVSWPKIVAYKVVPS